MCCTCGRCEKRNGTNAKKTPAASPPAYDPLTNRPRRYAPKPENAKPGENGDVVRHDRRRAGEPHRNQHERDAVKVLAEGQGEFCRPERVRVKEPQRLVQRRVVIPVENPDVEIGIPRIGHGAVQIARQRPRHDHRERDEQQRGKRIAAVHNHTIQ